MTTERDPRTRIVLSWLREDAHENAEGVLLRALDEVDTTPQRRSWWPAWRIERMRKTTSILVAASAVLVALIGYNLLPGLSGPNKPSAPPSVAPTASLSGTASTPPPLPHGSLAAGTYLFSAEFSRKTYTMTVPAGWTHVDNFIQKGDPWEGNGVAFATWIVSHVYADSCDWEGTLRPAGSVELLATALGEQTGHDTSSPTQVTFGGYPATRLELSLAASFDSATCDQGYLRLWPDGPAETYGLPIVPGQTTTVYVMDVNGLAMLAVRIVNDGSSPADVIELDAVIASIEFLR